MRANELEKSVIESMLADSELGLGKSAIDFDKVSVSDREYTGAGFITEFRLSEELRLSDSGVSERWGKVGARVNSSKLETGYLIYIDDGYLTNVEGYTYGEEWPDAVEFFELYELKPGLELTHQTERVPGTS